MFGKILRNQFQAMGAEVHLAVAGSRFEIGIDQDRRGETFQLRFPEDGSVTANVLDADRNRRHLLLDVAHRTFGVRQKYLCGHDEFHWFVAALPERPAVGTVLEAMEALKPQGVQREQRTKRVKRKQRSKRRTSAYVRQGEWFFLPRPEFDPSSLRVEHHGALVRGAGKPHRVEMLCRDREGTTFVCGRVSHPDHATIRLDVWHQVLRNTEVQASDTAVERRRAEQLRAVFEMKYLD